MDATRIIMNNMTLEEKIYQMLCVRNIDVSKVHELADRGVLGALDIGVISRMVKSESRLEETIELINEFMKKTKSKLWLWVPVYEGIYRVLQFGTKFPTMMALGATQSEELAYKLGKAIAAECKALQGTVMGSLILDVNSNPDNPIINTRAMSDDPDLIIRLASSYLKGTQEVGVVDVGHHFPGHGDTALDSHITMPVVEYSKPFLLNRELKTFKALIDQGMWGILTAHIRYPSLTDTNEGDIAATLSKSIITNLLKHELKFNGLVVSDSLSMKGIADYYETGTLAKLTIQAGHDVILANYGENPQISVDAIMKAVKDGELDIEQIDNSVLKILEFRKTAGNLQHQPIDLLYAKSIIGCQDHIEIAREVADKSVTVLENQKIVVPNPEQKKVLVITAYDEDDGKIIKDMGAKIISKIQHLHGSVKQYCPHADLITFSQHPDSEEISKLIQTAQDYDVVVFGSFTRVVAYKHKSTGINDQQIALINQLNRSVQQFIVCIFGSPYVVRDMDRLQNCICTYSDCEYSVDACSKVIFGLLSPTGKLPVTINEKYTLGYGLR
jgi:beta-N-acetylhexosaminidase